MTVAELLAAARRTLHPRPGMLFPQREARAFLAELFGESEAHVLAHPEREVPEPLAARFFAFCQRRQAGEPFHLILGRCPFYGREFLVAPGVLVPRPETELLVEAALRLPLPPRPRVLDVGTGSGVLAVTLALELPQARLAASDVDWQALALARQNAQRHGAAVRFALGSLAAPWGGLWELVVANLPYLPEDYQAPPELAWENPRALFAGHDGLALLRPFVAQLPRLLAPSGFAVLEVGEGQAEKLAAEAPASLVPHDVVFDARGVARVLVLRRR
jgi:release factor glutamine methyltransferase